MMINKKIAVKVLDYIIHIVAITLAMIPTMYIGYSDYVTSLYIGKAFLIFITVWSIAYVIFRIILCKIFKPIVNR